MFIETVFRIALAVKLALFTAFVATLIAVTPAAARDVQCTGEDLMGRIGFEHPEAMARIDARAAAMPNGIGRHWRVEKKGVVPSHLFGTIHITDPRATTVDPAVMERIRKARTLLVEIAEIGDNKATEAAMAKHFAKIAYLDGTTLADRMDPRVLERIRPMFVRRMMLARPQEAGDPATADQMWTMMGVRMRPWTLLGMFAMPACEAARQGAGGTIQDVLLIRTAREAGVPVEGLETIGEQVDVMAGMPEPLMLAALADVARMGPLMDDMFETMVSLYETGDIARIWAMMSDPIMATFGDGSSDADAAQAMYAAFQARVIDERNANMVERMTAHLEKGNAFVAVGALHMPGEKGIVEMLRQRGWTVTAVE